MKIIFIMAAAAVGLTPALAEPAAKESRGDRMICKTVKTTGTRLSRERVCAKQREWDRYADETQTDTRTKMDRSAGSPPPPQ